MLNYQRSYILQILLLLVVISSAHLNNPTINRRPILPKLKNNNINDYRDCVFLHGSGELQDMPITDTFPDYWGNVENYTPQCREHVFNHHQTVTRRYDDPFLMLGYCEVATFPEGGYWINNKIVFTHSMGNLILAAAIRAGLCAFNLSSSSWYEVSGPILGSKACDYVETICVSRDRLEEPMRDLAVHWNYCNSSKPGDANLAYLSMSTDDLGLPGLSKIVKDNIKGAMCGTSPFGLLSRDSLELEALSDFVGFGEKK